MWHEQAYGQNRENPNSRCGGTTDVKSAEDPGVT